MKRNLTVYLAGPITGCCYKGATDWRDWVIKELEGEYICLSPMRAKTYLEGMNDVSSSYDSLDRDHEMLPDIGKILSSNKGINRRDSWDCRYSDCLLVNLSDLPENKDVVAAIKNLDGFYFSVLKRKLGKWTKRISIGTVLEIGMAWMNRKPIIGVMPPGNIHEHPMVEDMIDFRCDSLEQAVEVLRNIR